MSLNRVNPRRDQSEAEIVEYLEKRGAVVEYLSGQSIPDLLVGYAGRWLLVECKTGRAALSPGQTAWHQAATAKGLPVYVVRTADEVAKIIDRVARL